jgi:hypothetical protein
MKTSLEKQIEKLLKETTIIPSTIRSRWSDDVKKNIDINLDSFLDDESEQEDKEDDTLSFKESDPYMQIEDTSTTDNMESAALQRSQEQSYHSDDVISFLDKFDDYSDSETKTFEEQYNLESFSSIPAADYEDDLNNNEEYKICPRCQLGHMVPIKSHYDYWETPSEYEDDGTECDQCGYYQVAEEV